MLLGSILCITVFSIMSPDSARAADNQEQVVVSPAQQAVDTAIATAVAEVTQAAQASDTATATIATAVEAVTTSNTAVATATTAVTTAVAAVAEVANTAPVVATATVVTQDVTTAVLAVVSAVAAIPVEATTSSPEVVAAQAREVEGEEKKKGGVVGSCKSRAIGSMCGAAQGAALRLLTH